MFENLDRILRLTIHGLFLTLFFFLPLIFWIPNSEVFELPKMYFVYAATTLISGLWLARMVVRREIIVKRTPLDIPVLLFLISQIASTIYSIDPHVSWFGWYGRFNGGLWSTISYTLLYYALVSNISENSENSDSRNVRKSDNQRAGTSGFLNLRFSEFSGSLPRRQAGLSIPSVLIFAILASTVIVSAYAILQHFGIDKNFWLQDVMNRVFSTQGQPNWLAGYLVMAMPIAIIFTNIYQFSINTNKPMRKNNLVIGLLGYWIIGLFFTALLFTKSRSGLLGFAVTDVVFWVLIFFSFKRFTKSFFITHCLLIILFLITNSSVRLQPSAFSLRPSPTKSELGGTESGDIRRLVWNGAMELIKQRPVFGFGPETFGLTYWQVRPKEANLTSEWNFLYNKAHNEWLNLAANTGIFGLGTHLLLLGWFSIWILKGQALPRKGLALLNYAILAGLWGVEVVNFFGFSTVTIGTYRYLFMGLAVAVITESKEQRVKSKEQRNRLPFTIYCLLFTVFLTVLYLLSQISFLFLADLKYNRGRQLAGAGYYADALEPLSQAVNLAPNEPVFRNELAEIQSTLAIILSSRDPSSLTPQDDIETLVQSSLANFRIISGQSKYNLIFTRTQAQMEFLMRQIDPDLAGEALMLAQKAIDLSPTDPRGYYLLGRMYGELGDKIRAEKLYRQALGLKPDYEEAIKILNSEY